MNGLTGVPRPRGFFPVTAGSPQVSRASERAGGQRPYKPTFYLPQWDLWLTHHRFDEDGMPPAWLQDGAQYVEEAARARATLRADGSPARGVLQLVVCRRRLGPAAQMRARSGRGGGPEPGLEQGVWPPGVSPRHGSLAEQGLRWFYASVSRYIQLLSEGGHDPGAVFAESERPPDPRRLRLFKQACAPVWDAYQRSKQEKERIDFADMIRLARETLASGDVAPPLHAHHRRRVPGCLPIEAAAPDRFARAHARIEPDLRRRRLAGHQPLRGGRSGPDDRLC